MSYSFSCWPTYNSKYEHVFNKYGCAIIVKTPTYPDPGWWKVGFMIRKNSKPFLVQYFHCQNFCKNNSCSMNLSTFWPTNGERTSKHHQAGVVQLPALSQKGCFKIRLKKWVQKIDSTFFSICFEACQNMSKHHCFTNFVNLKKDTKKWAGFFEQNLKNQGASLFFVCCRNTFQPPSTKLLSFCCTWWCFLRSYGKFEMSCCEGSSTQPPLVGEIPSWWISWISLKTHPYEAVSAALCEIISRLQRTGVIECIRFFSTG